MYSEGGNPKFFVKRDSQDAQQSIINGRTIFSNIYTRGVLLANVSRLIRSNIRSTYWSKTNAHEYQVLSITSILSLHFKNFILI